MWGEWMRFIDQTPWCLHQICKKYLGGILATWLNQNEIIYGLIPPSVLVIHVDDFDNSKIHRNGFFSSNEQPLLKGRK